MFNRLSNFFWIIILVLVSCNREESSGEYIFPLPKGFDQPVIREDNPMDYAKIDLGKKLFFEPILSLDSTISCASCHIPQRAFSAPQAISPGVGGKFAMRNAPSLSNLAWYPYFFAEGGSPNLEAQILGPLEDPNEMSLSAVTAVARLKQNPEYIKLFKQVFNDSPSVYTLTRAIAAFERNLISGNSAFDKYYYQKQDDALSEEQKRGFKLFNSDRLKCAECHSGYLFTDFSFHNIGLFNEYKDPGRERLTLKKEDHGKFKVPSLRNIAVTGPYMHNGSVETLEDVIDLYESGGFPYSNKSDKIQPLELTIEEKSALIAFLHSLTDSSYISFSY